MPDQRSFYPTSGASVTLDGAEHAPLRYVAVHNLSAGATVAVYRGGGAAAEPLFTVPPGLSLGVQIPDQDRVTVAYLSGTPAPGDQVICSADTAHLPPFASRTGDTSSVRSGVAITPGTAFALTRGISCATAGNATITMEDGTTPTVYLAAGVVHPIRCTNVAAAGLTAATLVAWY